MSLHRASEEGNNAQISLLLQNSHTPEHLLSELDEYGDSPLHYAASANHLDTVTLLLTEGAQPNKSNDNKITPLHTAARFGHTPILKVLIAKGSTVDLKDNSGWTALHYASINGKDACVDELIKIGGINLVTQKTTDGYTALHLAANSGFVGCVSRLLTAGADITVKDKSGDTPLVFLPFKETKANPVVDEATELGEDLRNLWINKIGSDLSLRIGTNKKFEIHKILVMARVPQLGTIINKNIKNPKQVELDEDVICDQESWDLFFEWMYTGTWKNYNIKNVKNIPRITKEVIYLADFYNCKKFSDFLESAIFKYFVKFGNAVEILTEIADENNGKFQRLVLEYVVKNFNEIAAATRGVSSEFSTRILPLMISEMEIEPTRQMPRYESRLTKSSLAMTKDIASKVYDIIKVMMRDSDAWPFNQPVDPEALNIPNYFDIIKTPIDLGTIKTRLKSGFYLDHFQFAGDVRLVFTNALTYNEPGSQICTWAKKLRTKFEKLWEDFIKEVGGPSVAPGTTNNGNANGTGNGNGTGLGLGNILTTPDVSRQKLDVAPTIQKIATKTPVIDSSPIKEQIAEPQAMAKTNATGLVNGNRSVVLEYLSETINNLDNDHLMKVVEIMKSSGNSGMGNMRDEEVEVDLYDIDDATLLKMEKYVRSLESFDSSVPPKQLPDALSTPENNNGKKRKRRSKSSSTSSGSTSSGSSGKKKRRHSSSSSSKRSSSSSSSTSSSSKKRRSSKKEIV